MVIAEKAWDDTILPFQLDRADVRGRFARLDATLERILGQHDYPDPVAALVAESVLLTALIGQAIRPGWKLSMQIRGDGPVRLIATDYFGPEQDSQTARMRAYAGFDADMLGDGTAAPFDLIGRGMVAILIDQGQGTTPYQGITPATGGSLAASVETYFAQSEQLPTRFAMAMAEAQEPGDRLRWRAGGIMLQHMPKASPFARKDATGEAGLLTRDDILIGDDEENWTRSNLLLDTADATELIGPHVTPDQLLVRLFHDEGPRVFDVQPVQFGCTCGPHKVVQSLSIYSAEDIAGMTTADGKVTADCQFCGAHYVFDPADLGAGSDG